MSNDKCVTMVVPTKGDARARATDQHVASGPGGEIVVTVAARKHSHVRSASTTGGLDGKQAKQFRGADREHQDKTANRPQ